jgi:hypothetical protein
MDAVIAAHDRKVQMIDSTTVCVHERPKNKVLIHSDFDCVSIYFRELSDDLSRVSALLVIIRKHTHRDRMLFIYNQRRRNRR